MSRFYTQPALSVNGEVAEAAELNNVNIGADTGFILVAAEIDAQLASGAAQIELARKWAEELENVPVTPGAFSAFHWATKAAASAAAAATSAAAALASQNAAAGSASTASTQAGISTAQAVIATTQAGIATTKAGEAAASAVLTAADRVQTGLDRVATGQDKVATAADRVQTGLNKVATAADRVQTGLDRSSATSSAATATTKAGIATTKAAAALASANAAAASAAVIPMPVAADAGSVLTATGAGTNEYLPVRGRKNYLVDGGFDVWLEGTTQSSVGYGSDTMWYNGNFGSTKVHSLASFTLGQTLVPGNPHFASQTVVTSVAGPSNFVNKYTHIEDVTRLGGKTITISFWAKADSNRNMAIDLIQNFGTGGSPSTVIAGIGAQLVPLTNTFQKFVITVAVPSVSGKILGTDNNDRTSLRFWFDAGTTYTAEAAGLGQQSGVFTIAQVQVEEGPVATEFEDRSYAEIIADVFRYFEVGFTRGPAVQYAATFSAFSMSSYTVQKRAVPAIELVSMSTIGATGTIGTLYNNYATASSFTPVYNWTAGTAGRGFQAAYNWSADARL